MALPFAALRAFEAASRLGSFKAAALELAVTPTAISHQVKRLETYLGASLFERLHRALKLTPTGRLLAKDVQKLFAGFERAIDRLKVEGRTSGPMALTVSAVPSLAAKWLTPRLHGFQAAHPRLGLRIVADEALVDFRRDRAIDIALRYGPEPVEKGLHAERLWPAGRIIAVGQPDIARDLARKSPADLERHMLIRTAPPKARSRSPRSTTALDWAAWFNAAGMTMKHGKALHGPVFNTTQLALEAAIAGRGVALAPEILVAGDIVAGRLTRLFRVSLADPNSFWLICRAGRAQESHIRAFIAWIRREARSR